MYDYPETVEEVLELMDELIGACLQWDYLPKEEEMTLNLLQLQLEKATALYFQG